VCVEPRSFRQQLKILSLRAPSSAQPTGSAYARFLAVAHQIANKLADRGQIPRDLMDVHDFIRFTLGPASSAKPARVKAKPAPEEPADEAESE
jgi:hypothetical protein